jgi:hypothetical protein
MGQQQLLLIVLGIVVVGIAVLVGINAYSESSVKSNSDALLQEALRIASDAQVWKAKPEMMGGSPDDSKGSQANFSDLDYMKLGYSSNHIVDADCYRTQNGEFVLFAENTFVGVLATSVANKNMVGVIVTGGRSDDVALYEADWNPTRGGARPDGSSIEVDSHQRCNGKGQVPIHAGD